MRRVLTTVIVTAAFAVGCSDQLGPLGSDARQKNIAAAGTAGIALDKEVGTLNEQNVTVIAICSRARVSCALAAS